MRPYTRVYATINLDAVEHNIKELKRRVGSDTQIIGVVKADGYGHGAVPVAKVIEEQVCGYAVATIDEALILQKHGITKPILILGVTHKQDYETLIHHDIRATIFRMEEAKALSAKAVAMGKSVRLHLALDTGMSRIGMVPNEASADMAEEMSHLPGIIIEGAFTHFSKADETDKTVARQQLELYLNFINLLKQKGIDVVIRHCSNSAGIVDIGDANLDAVRAGIAMYGLYPSEQVGKEQVILEPVMELKSCVTYIKTISPGTAVSYGGTFVAEKEMTIATIPVGYGDGYPRNQSGKGSVLIHGKRARILGRVCMDQMMVDVTNIKETREDDEVILIGRDQEEQITVEEMASTGGGFHYEIICDIGKRVPRVYLKDNKIIGTKDYFNDQYKDIQYE